MVNIIRQMINCNLNVLILSLICEHALHRDLVQHSHTGNLVAFLKICCLVLREIPDTNKVIHGVFI